MKFSEQWLREWVNPSVSSDELCHQLTMAGLEVDAVEPVAGEFSSVVVGEVLSVEPHPDADKLRVTQVNVGADEPLQIVCGAANVRQGLRVPCAVVGARLPGDFKIKKAKLRGVPSNGMLCSEKELGLAESSDGLMELPVDAPVGEDIRVYLGLDDATIELGLTPNRGDCLSIAGIAREAGVLNAMAVNGPACEPVAARSDETFPVRVQAAGACPRYLGRVIRGIDPAVESPLWMQERLRRCGVRSLGPVVDVTNYVLLELGQPMHAFDLGKLSGSIQVREAVAGEKLKLLNDAEVELSEGSLLIADDNGPLALAGIMGGADSAVGDETRDIFLEAAFFSPAAMAGRARGYGLHTDSSHRFERGVDFELPRRAMERASELLLAIVGGEPGPVIEVADEAQLPRAEAIALRHERLQRLLGAEVAREQVSDILGRLGLMVEENEAGWSVTAPSFRFDIAIEEDLIEEVARIVGYSNLPSVRPQGRLEMAPRSESRLPLSRLRRTLVARGYQEAITYSFVEPGVQAALQPAEEGIALANPISSELSQMRTSLWAGLIPVLQHNLNRQQERVRLFETGLRFLRRDGETVQQPMIAGLIYGELLAEQWGEKGRKLDFFDLKGDVEALLALGGDIKRFEFVPSQHPALHPGQAAEILLDGLSVGRLGALHPRLQKRFDLAANAYLFEIELDAIRGASLPKFSELSKFPAIRRDIAVIVDQQVSAADLEKAVYGAAPEELRNLKLFDVYVGKGIDSGRKSVAMGLTLQAQSRTLTDSDVDHTIEKVLAALKSELGASLRD